MPISIQLLSHSELDPNKLYRAVFRDGSVSGCYGFPYDWSSEQKDPNKAGFILSDLLRFEDPDLLASLLEEWARTTVRDARARQGEAEDFARFLIKKGKLKL